MTTNWNHQTVCGNYIIRARKAGEVNCLVKMFCGTGKTRIFHRYIMMSKHANLSLVVFPTLPLSSQFTRDYIIPNEYDVEFEHHRVSSKDDVDTIASTDKKDLLKFLKKKITKKIVIVTYASLPTVIECIESLDLTIDTTVFDEAHHVASEGCKDIVFSDSFPSRFNLFFTATPSERCDKYTLIYDYTHVQAVEHKICQDFEICLYMSDTSLVVDVEGNVVDESDFDDTCSETSSTSSNTSSSSTTSSNTSSIEKVKKNITMLAGAIAQSGCRRIIINHTYSEAEHEVRSSVTKFATKENEKLLKGEIKRLSPLSSKPKKVVLKGVTGKSKDKSKIVEEFDNGDDSIYIISNCQVFSEGIDTKSADMCVFMDPKGSITSIIQNIGRITRKKTTQKKSMILLPIIVNYDMYNNAQTPEARDEVLRSFINEEDNFNTILNVFSALRQDDPEYYEMCLKYPNMYSPKEVLESITKAGKKLEEKVGTLKELFEDDIEDDDTLEEVAKKIGKPIRVMTQDMKNTFEEYYVGSDVDGVDGVDINLSPVELFRNEEGKYQFISQKDTQKKILKPKRKPFSNKIKVMSDNETKILWSMDEMKSKLIGDVLVSIKSELIDNKGVERWKAKLEEAKAYIREFKKRPSQTNEETKTLGTWLTNQTANFKTRKNIMKTSDEVYSLWNEFVTDPEFSQYMVIDPVAVWKEKLEQAKAYIREFKKRPSQTNEETKTLGTWLTNQTANSNPRKQIMKTSDEVYDLWNEFVNDPEFSPYMVIDPVADWKEKLEEAKAYIREFKKRPSTRDEETKTLGKWLYVQIKNTNPRKQIMKTSDEVYSLWNEFVTDPEFKEYFPNLQDLPSTLTKALPPTKKTKEEIRKKHENDTAEELREKLVIMKYQAQSGTYDAPSKKEDPDKIAINKLFSGASKKVRIGRTIGNALILESSNFLTTNALLSIGYSEDTIYIPQYREKEYKVMKTTRPTVNIHLSSMYDFLDKGDDIQFTATWFDYTCTYNGNEICRPEQDIELYFSRRFAENESIFAVTFCKRHPTVSVEDVVDETRSKIQEIAKKNKYVLSLCDIKEYGNMYYISWEVYIMGK